LCELAMSFIQQKKFVCICLLILILAMLYTLYLMCNSNYCIIHCTNNGNFKKKGNNENLHKGDLIKGDLNKGDLNKGDLNKGDNKKESILQDAPGKCKKYANKTDCQPLHYSYTPLPRTTLSSIPGSGNTWVRHLLQQMTGIYTGSRYFDKVLYKNGFPGEAKVIPWDGSVIAVKSHDFNDVYDKMIALIRNPYDMILAEFKRVSTPSKNHSVNIANTIFQQRKNEFTNKVNRMGSRWFTQMNIFVNKVIINTTRKTPFIVIHYENLKQHLRHELRRLADFLNTSITNELLDCIECKSEGRHHRHSTEKVDPFTLQQKLFLNNYITQLNRTLKKACGELCVFPYRPHEITMT
ncbi:unnamed protein product, partial [Owenia fusiformis]